MFTSGCLILGTHNRKKREEMAALLGNCGLELRTLADCPNAIVVVEDGKSFAANAAMKATQQAVHLGQWVLGEDSGLSVNALDGAPGVFSARYAGEGATDDSNNRRLFDELRDVPPARRTAHYVCHMTLSDPSGTVRADCEAICRGRIACQPAGNAGFGYDPLFEIVEYHRTFGQLGETVKSILSHRARAMRLLIPQLLSLAPRIRREPHETNERSAAIGHVEPASPQHRAKGAH